MTSPFAAGALCSTVLDLVDWTDALFGGQVVSDDSLKAMITPGALNDGSPIDYGFGLGIGDLEGHRTIRHGGGINGFVTMLAHFPDDDLTVTVLTNTPGPTAGRLTERIARLALDLGPPPDPETSGAEQSDDPDPEQPDESEQSGDTEERDESERREGRQSGSEER